MISLSAYTIAFDKHFDLNLKPDTITTHIHITTLKPTEKDVLKKLSSFSTFISGYKDIDKKGGNYSVNPEYRYENNHRYKNGYRGNMDYTISSNRADDINTFITHLHDKKKDFDVDISISNVSWQLSPSQKEGQEDKLRLQAFQWINNYAKVLSKELDSHCTVTKISLVAPQFNHPQSPMLREAKIVNLDSVPTPEQDEQKISINPHFELECK
jgi:uncharacterized protein YggE